jgi:hypothetical protein
LTYGIAYFAVRADARNHHWLGTITNPSGWLRDRVCPRLYGKGSITMTTPSEYRLMAKGCLRWAREARSDNAGRLY